MNLLILFFSLLVHANNSEIKELEIVDFKSIKNVLESDGLKDEAEKKLKEAESRKKSLEEEKRSLYDIPNEESFWPLMNDYWLVKKASLLKWNFTYPHYDLEETFKKFLEQMGFYEVQFKILILNTPTITHFSLPASKENNIVFLLSLPFLRTMDLSKQEMALLLFEDFLRAKKEIFKSFLSQHKLLKELGKNLLDSKLTKQDFDDLLKKYDEMIFERGFNFEEQFLVTKEMKQYLRGNEKLFKVYLGLLQKIDDLCKNNSLYKEYPRIYRSPELQRGWLLSKD